jgi:hypothetical protein
MLRQHFTNISSTVSLPKAALGICLAVLLAGSATPQVLADEAAGVKLPTLQIFKKLKDNYASMATYSDEGWVVNDRGTIINFSTRLARTNYYLIEWQQAGGPRPAAGNPGLEATWSSGTGDCLQAGGEVRSPGNREIALTQAAAFSGGATETVPRVFFDLRWVEEPLDDLVFRVDRQADEKVGNISCYVFSKGAMGVTNTLWIGKQDFLIYQARMVANMKSMPTFTATETHTNIVLNRSFSPADFVPLFPVFQASDNRSN